MRKHRLIDRFPIGGSLLFGLLLMILRELISVVLKTVHEGVFGQANELVNIFYVIIGAALMFLFYKLWFSPEFKGVLIDGDVKKGFSFLWVFPVYWLITAIAMMIDHTFSFRGVSLETVRVSLTAGVVEELVFRHGVVSTMLRNRNQKDQLIKVCLISSAFFGLVHALNLVAGANPVSTIMQTITAGCLGVLFAAVLMRSGSLWPCIISHTLHDIYAISTTSEVTESGIITGGVTFSGIIDMICCVILALYGIYKIMPQDKRDEIVELWNRKWHKDGMEPVKEAE